MATIKSYTDIEQSCKLAEILPLESADMHCPWDIYSKSFLNIPIVKDDSYHVQGSIDCWSLAALLEQLPYELCDDDGNSLYLKINKEDDLYQLEYTDPYGNFENIETDRYEHFIDACYEMIIKLHELNLL